MTTRKTKRKMKKRRKNHRQFEHSHGMALA
jgi:hypothetical protein